ncbi:hypothetical protein PVAND_001224 [Polypedilum vanderplanki]|uniref:MD-2-related lipid-recognition domain-containing protein n=1 Tax=Polypedilum vanderplanki TaxID=319348 RepID=A0A9J6BMU7_POLVA|nr:hypothetical protein PVAND_001224 [Polypedilum vanderplanki]
MNRQIFLIICSSLLLSASAEFIAIPYGSCGEGFEDLSCTIESVTVQECDIIEKKFCELIRGESYQMNMTFIPQFEGSDLSLKAYAIINGKELPFEEMNSKACDYMECPIKKGVQQDYVFNVNVDMLKPRGKFNVRWLMKQGNENRCCFTNKFKIA